MPPPPVASLEFRGGCECDCSHGAAALKVDAPCMDISDPQCFRRLILRGFHFSVISMILGFSDYGVGNVRTSPYVVLCIFMHVVFSLVFPSLLIFFFQYYAIQQSKDTLHVRSKQLAGCNICALSAYKIVGK